MEEKRDRMSQLPDDILLLILGKMDTFEVAKTTILSRRWKHLWRLVPSLRFHLSCTGHYVFDLEDLTIRFSHMVSRCLSHRDSAAAVLDFHLSLDVPSYCNVDDEFLDEIVEECVLYAINHDVQSVRVHTNGSLTLPKAFISCKTLRELDLRQSYMVSVPGRLSLPNLKTLYLETELCFRGNDNKMEPFSGLPELEKLTLIDTSLIGLGSVQP
ncbi:F-box/FBD/LRR-repeat protein At3g26920-like [Salvia hispanica]|uniref:F-box/FBD/LRR-repeat protein At3g26920-like n=1 Tax=Salvia hispanica TaxID=49212 RepID=UPI00200963CD|nr:F-box/FBD/LRR-repeat protein At3g26920-like [Salvia hispanica]